MYILLFTWIYIPIISRIETCRLCWKKLWVDKPTEFGPRTSFSGQMFQFFVIEKWVQWIFFHQSKSFVKKSCLRDFEFWIPTNFWTGDFIFHWPYCAGRRGACRSRSRSFFSDKITRFGSWRTSSIKTKRQMKLHRFGYSWFMPQIFSLTSLKLCWLFLSLCFLLFYLQH